jgi:RNA polymerase sigma-70 factor, ECF subfamily
VPTQIQTPDDDLLRRLKAGEEAAYSDLANSLTDYLLGVARRITQTEADAEDAVQEAFLSAFKSISEFDGRSTLKTWLHRIVVNAALLRLRKQKARAEIPIEQLLPAFANGLHSNHPKPWRDVTNDPSLRIEEREALWLAMDQLPEEFRTIVIMRDVEGMPSKEVAKALGMSDALARQRLHRGRQALVKLLDPVMRVSAE